MLWEMAPGGEARALGGWPAPHSPGLLADSRDGPGFLHGRGCFGSGGVQFPTMCSLGVSFARRPHAPPSCPQPFHSFSSSWKE